MAKLSLLLRMSLSLVVSLGGASLAADYRDDSECGDYPEYPLPERRAETRAELQEEVESPGERTRRVAAGLGVQSPALTEARWTEAERVYRYTKHRIPGYDYEELEAMGRPGTGRRCDDRSVWTHCLCQFTCSEPGIVDCYTPCTSGCECREDYVYDERTGECVHLEQCQPEDDYMLY